MPTNPKWFEMGPRDRDQKYSRARVLLCMGFSSLPLWLLPGSLFPPRYPYTYVLLCLLNAYLPNFPSDPNKVFHASSPNGSHCTTAPLVSDIFTKKDLLDAVGKQVKKDLGPFHPKPDTILYFSALFSPDPCLWVSVAPSCFC